MKTGWKTRTLGDVATVVAGNSAPQDEALFKDGTIPFFRTADAGRVRFGDIFEAKDRLNERGAAGLRRFQKGTILFPKSGASTFLNHRVLLCVDGCVSSHLATIVADEAKAHPRFLLYFLSTVQSQDLVQDHAYPSLNLPTIAGISVPVPPIPEQKRIIGILDEAFEGIATAKANAEKNLQNARALFESHLNAVFTQRGEGWVEKNFDEICVLQRGFDLPSHSRKEGIFPLVSSNGITDRIDTWKVKAPGVVTGRSGTIGNVHYIEEDYWPLNTSLYIKDFHGNYERYIYYFLKQFDLSKYSSGAGVPTLNRNNVHGVKVWFPKDTAEQKSIATKLDALSEETQRLESIYQQKLAALEALKKSLLNQAFSGEL